MSSSSSTSSDSADECPDFDRDPNQTPTTKPPAAAPEVERSEWDQALFNDQTPPATVVAQPWARAGPRPVAQLKEDLADVESKTDYNLMKSTANPANPLQRFATKTWVAPGEDVTASPPVLNSAGANSKSSIKSRSFDLRAGALATMAATASSRRESVTLEDRVDAGLSYCQFSGKDITKRDLSTSEATDFIIGLSSNCSEQYQNRSQGDGFDETVHDSSKTVCRWLHLRGVNFRIIDTIGTAFELDPEVIERCKNISAKAEVSWHDHRTSKPVDGDASHRAWGVQDMRYDHMFIVAHYLQRGNEQSEGADMLGLKHGIIPFDKEQMTFILVPDFNMLISVDGNGEKDMAPIDALLYNERSPIRKSAQAAMVMLAVVDSMVDEVYPLLDLYGDTIEGLEFMMMKADEPTMTHVALSYKVRKLVNSLRRYAWETRNLTQELRQDQHGVMPQIAKQGLLKSVEDNADNMVEVANAVLEECGGAADFYESFQEKVIAGTLYVLTIATVTIMPAQMMTGLFGMNFQGSPETRDPDTGLGGKGGMSELGWKYGYHLFWTLCIVLTGLSCLLMYKGGMLKNRETSWATVVKTDDSLEIDTKKHLHDMQEGIMTPSSDLLR